MLPQLINMLSWWQWAILAAVPPAIIALYFLKLKRRPLQVPSTYLWRKSVEDLHVNSIWQRLRRNLLLFLQLLLIALAMLALLRPGWRGARLTGDRFIFLIDNSASMQSTDIAPSRLAEAKRQVAALVEQMDSGDVAMIVSFSDAAQVAQMFTDNRRQLRQSLEAIEPTARPTSLLEALTVASGLANPGRSAEDVTDFQVAEALPAKLYVFSDGNFDDVADFSLGNLEPVYVPIGTQQARNIGILAFEVRRHETKPDVLQAYARLENFAEEDTDVELELALDGDLIDAASLDVPGGDGKGIVFDLDAVGTGSLRLRATTDDHLAIDDEAFAAVEPSRRAEVLVVTPGNEPLELALATDAALELAATTVQGPEFLESADYRAGAASGRWDLVIYDRCAPEAMPQCNTLFIAAVPPVGDWSAGPKLAAPQIIDTDPAHPLMQWLDLSDVLIAEAVSLETPETAGVLLDADTGPLLAIAPRAGYEDAVLAVPLVDEIQGPDGKPQRVVGTNWPIRSSFPVFMFNVVDYLGRNDDGTGGVGGYRPGESVVLECDEDDESIRVRVPGGEVVRVRRSRPGEFNFVRTDRTGIYRAECGKQQVKRFAVNLFDATESDIPTQPDGTIKIGYVEVAAETGWEPVRLEIWKPLLLAGLVVLLAEWYIYRRRVGVSF